MSKFNTTLAHPVGRGPITSETSPSGATFQGAPGYARDAKSELFLLAVANFVGEPTFYENANSRDSRFTELVKAVAVSDFDWLTRFAGWLRSDANMRSASLVLAAEAVRARTTAGLNGSRGIVNTVLQRPDEPGEFIAYWHSRYGRKLPQPVKRGVADAAVRLYTERAVLKYDTASHGVRFADVIRLTHPTPKAQWQEHLFHYVIGKRIGVDELALPAELETLARNASLRTLKPAQIVQLAEIGTLAPVLADAGATWESIPALVDGPWTKELWESIIPSMGIFALVRNLRNFDAAGVSDDVAQLVIDKLRDPEVIAKSRMFPFRFYAAHKHLSTFRWSHALDQAINLSLANVPTLKGRTLILVDQSPSMFPGYVFSTPNTSDITFAEKAVLFGSALALRSNDATLVGYGWENYRIQVPKTGSVLKLMGQFHVTDGTDTAAAIADNFAGHDRIVIVTDEQTSHSRRGLTVDTAAPRDVPIYTWNLGGYRHGHAANGPHRHSFAGLTDHAFRQIPLLENGTDTDWPF